MPFPLATIRLKLHEYFSEDKEEKKGKSGQTWTEFIELLSATCTTSTTIEVPNDKEMNTQMA